ncbi:MAG TPA: hypothetical protein VMS49_04760, partial [Lysobacter sp.]|nr:hypothetical protein [Lysobacter sp.]
MLDAVWAACDDCIEQPRYSENEKESRSLLESVAASQNSPMTLALDRGLALLERLCGQPEGMPLTA